jgi:hypothetical protein
MDQKIGAAIKALWADQAIKATLEKRGAFQLIDSAQYYFEIIDQVRPLLSAVRRRVACRSLQWCMSSCRAAAGSAHAFAEATDPDPCCGPRSLCADCAVVVGAHGAGRAAVARADDGHRRERVHH